MPIFQWMFSRSLHRTNPASVAALLVGIALIPVGVGAAIVQHDGRVDSRKRALQNEARAQSERLDNYYSRARSLALITARNPGFRNFYAEPGSRAEKIGSGNEAVRDSNHALAYLEQLFPGSIGEACFIDRGGAENARAVKGKTERRSNLSNDETAASFFDPTFDLKPGEVYQSAPYVSPDTNEWVIANSTPIRAPGHAKPAIVHFEITIESLRGQAAASSERFDVAILNARTGDVVIDSRLKQRGGKPIRHKHPNGVHLHPAAPLGDPATIASTASRIRSDAAGTLDVGDKPAAFARVARQPHNANEWIVAAVSPTAAAAWYADLGVSEIAMLIGALLLLGFGAITLRSSQRELKDAALHDSLTGMPNRRSLMSDLEQRVRDATPERPLLLALYDLDGFKAYNDSFGHPVGDALLVRLGAQPVVHGQRSRQRLPHGRRRVLRARQDRRRPPGHDPRGGRRSSHRDRHGVQHHGVLWSGAAADRDRRRLGGPAPRRPADVRAQGRGPRIRGEAEHRRAAAHARGARSRPRNPPQRSHGAVPEDRRPTRHPRRGHDRADAGGRPPRRRQVGRSPTRSCRSRGR